MKLRFHVVADDDYTGTWVDHPTEHEAMEQFYATPDEDDL